jgi:hypothetical protein
VKKMSAKPLKKGDKVVMHTCGEAEIMTERYGLVGLMKANYTQVIIIQLFG